MEKYIYFKITHLQYRTILRNSTARKFKYSNIQLGIDPTTVAFTVTRFWYCDMPSLNLLLLVLPIIPSFTI